jgi:hypothetical protein
MQFDGIQGRNVSVKIIIQIGFERAWQCVSPVNCWYHEINIRFGIGLCNNEKLSWHLTAYQLKKIQRHDYHISKILTGYCVYLDI